MAGDEDIFSNIRSIYWKRVGKKYEEETPDTTSVIDDNFKKKQKLEEERAIANKKVLRENNLDKGRKK